LALAPDLDHAIDCPGREVGPIREDNHCRCGGRRERAQTAAKRRSRTELPFGTVNDSRARVERVCARDDDDVFD
jgi:hypothetical protein